MVDYVDKFVLGEQHASDRLRARVKSMLRETGLRHSGKWVRVDKLVYMSRRMGLGDLVHPDAVRLALEELATEGTCQIRQPLGGARLVHFGSTKPDDKPTLPQAGENRDSPVVLQGPGKPVIVLGHEKPPLSEGQYPVVEALVQAWPKGLTKDALEIGRGAARRALKKLVNSSDPDWSKVIHLPGKPQSGGYRLVDPRKPAAV